MTLGFFCDAAIGSILNLKIMLLCLESMPGMQVNLAKTELITVGAKSQLGLVAGT